MSDQDAEVLQARIDGLQEAFLALGAMLNREGLLSGQVLQMRIRERAEHLPQLHPVGLEQMDYLADQLLRNYLHGRGVGREEIETRIQSDGAAQNHDPD